MPRSLSSSAIARRLLAPPPRMSSTTGARSRAWRSAFFAMAARSGASPLPARRIASMPLGLPSLTPRLRATICLLRADGNLLPLPGSLRGGAATKVVAALLVRGLVEEQIVESAAKADPALNTLWRSLDDGRGVLLRITPAGRDALGIEADSAAWRPRRQAEATRPARWPRRPHAARRTGRADQTREGTQAGAAGRDARRRRGRPSTRSSRTPGSRTRRGRARSRASGSAAPSRREGRRAWRPPASNRRARRPLHVPTPGLDPAAACLVGGAAAIASPAARLRGSESPRDMGVAVDPGCSEWAFRPSRGTRAGCAAASWLFRLDTRSATAGADWAAEGHPRPWTVTRAGCDHENPARCTLAEVLARTRQASASRRPILERRPPSGQDGSAVRSRCCFMRPHDDRLDAKRALHVATSGRIKSVLKCWSEGVSNSSKSTPCAMKNSR